MKQNIPTIISSGATVAPYAGAWIETLQIVQFQKINFVAPYAGAWIETIV